MEMNLTEIAWPLSVLQCNEALNQLQPGEELNLTVRDPGVIANIVLLIKSREDLRFQQFRQSGSHRLMIHRVAGTDGDGKALPGGRSMRERSKGELT
jgi:TusA-related sulfurtransferase